GHQPMKHTKLALLACAALSLAAPTAAQVKLNGAGATVPNIIYEDWRERPSSITRKDSRPTPGPRLQPPAGGRGTPGSRTGESPASRRRTRPREPRRPRLPRRATPSPRRPSGAGAETNSPA